MSSESGKCNCLRLIIPVITPVGNADTGACVPSYWKSSGNAASGGVLYYLPSQVAGRERYQIWIVGRGDFILSARMRALDID